MLSSTDATTPGTLDLSRDLPDVPKKSVAEERLGT